MIYCLLFNVEAVLMIGRISILFFYKITVFIIKFQKANTIKTNKCGLNNQFSSSPFIRLRISCFYRKAHPTHF